MESSHGSRKRKLRREPLSDLTNTPSLSSSVSSLKPKSKPKPNSPEPLKLGEISVTYDSGRRSRNPETPRDRRIPASALLAKEISVDPVENSKKSEHSVANTRRSALGRRDKGKAVAAGVTSSCPPVGRIRSTGHTLKMGHGDVDLPETFSVPCPIEKQRRPTMSEVLSPEYIEKQRAYFAEIDAFELQEEVVSDSDAFELPEEVVSKSDD